MIYFSRCLVSVPESLVAQRVTEWINGAVNITEVIGKVPDPVVHGDTVDVEDDDDTVGRPGEDERQQNSTGPLNNYN